MKNLSEAGDGDEPDSTYEEPIEEPLPSGCQHRLHPSTTPLKTCPSKREALFFHSHHLYWPFFSTYGGLACLNSAIRLSPQHPIASIKIHYHLSPNDIYLFRIFSNIKIQRKYLKLSLSAKLFKCFHILSQLISILITSTSISICVPLSRALSSLHTEGVSHRLTTAPSCRVHNNNITLIQLG